jgi:hypothetical protein
MVISSNNNFEVFPNAFESQKRARPSKKWLNFQQIPRFSQNEVSPTNWGAAAILLPYVVSFKKILQKYFANDNPN